MSEKNSEKTILELEKELMSYYLQMEEEKKKITEEDTPENRKLNQIVNLLREYAINHESQITHDLLSLPDTNTYFVELEHRFKKRERLKEKIIQKMRVDNITMEAASNNIRDSLRYTIIIEDESYTRQVADYLRQIEDMGYQVIKFKNAWESPYYLGINVSFMTGDGFKFEVQFHTPKGFAIKEGKLREVYNVLRDPNTPIDIIQKVNVFREYYRHQVLAPKDAIDFIYESKGKRL